MLTELVKSEPYTSLSRGRWKKEKQSNKFGEKGVLLIKNNPNIMRNQDPLVGVAEEVEVVSKIKIGRKSML